jgi:hypothetical protein
MGSRSRGSQVGTERMALGAPYQVSSGCDVVRLHGETPLLTGRSRDLRQAAWAGLGVTKRGRGGSEVVPATRQLARPTGKGCTAPPAAQSLLQIIPSQIVFDFIWSAM